MSEIAHHAPAVVVQPDYRRLLTCIAACEAGDPKAIGGRLCWTRVAWYEETNLPFTTRMVADHGDAFAEQRLIKMAVRLASAGIAATPLTLGSCWRWGFDGTVQRIRSGAVIEYGVRVQNLYWDTGFYK